MSEVSLKRTLAKLAMHVGPETTMCGLHVLVSVFNIRSIHLLLSSSLLFSCSYYASACFFVLYITTLHYTNYGYINNKHILHISSIHNQPPYFDSCTQLFRYQIFYGFHLVVETRVETDTHLETGIIFLCFHLILYLILYS